MRIMMDECCCDNMGCSNLVERDNCCAPSSCPRTAKEHTAEISRDPCRQWIVSPHSSHGQPMARPDQATFLATRHGLWTVRRFPSTSSVVQVPNSTGQYSLVLYSLGPRHPSRGRAQHMTCLRSRRHKEHGPRCGLRTGWRACGDMACPRAAVFTPRPRSATLTVRDWLGNARGGLLQGSQQDRASVVLYETGLDWTGLDCSVSTLVDHAQGIV